MPLVQGSSRAAVSENIRREMETKPRKQAIAIALDIARRNRERGGRVVRDYDVPYLAGSSNKHGITYIDRRVPKELRIAGKMLDPSVPLSIHEQHEHALMQRGMSYEKAHKEATAKERAWVESHGFDWKAYEHAMDGMLSHIEHEKVSKAPPDLYLKPYPHDKQRLLRKARADGGAVTESAPQANFVERSFLGALNLAEKIGLGGTAVKLYNDAIQRGRTTPITGNDIDPQELKQFENLVRAHAAANRTSSGNIDYKDYAKHAPSLDTNILGGFGYTINPDDSISIRDKYDFNADRAGAYDNNALVQALGAFANPRGLAAKIGRDRLPDTGGHGIPVDITIGNQRAEGGAVEDDTLLPPPRNLANVFADNPVSHGVANAIVDPFVQAGRALRGQMTEDEAKEFALTAAMGLVSPMKGGALGSKGIRAYHGSPYDFEKFDLGKIGTGEGAQAYGHGLYFAENPKTAESYRDALTNRSYLTSGLPQGATNADYAAHALAAEHRDLDKARAVAQNAIDRGRTFLQAGSFVEDPKAVLRALDKVPPPNPGRMYEVSLNARPEQFLDWDASVTKQASPVLEALGKLKAPGVGDLSAANRTGSAAYEFLTGKNWTTYARNKYGPDARLTKEQASSSLRDAGIPGIRYLDQGSRTGGEGTRNYVVFDPSIINILRKYGISGMTAGGLGAATMKDKQEAGMANGGRMAALATAKHYADGGAPWYVRSEARSTSHVGSLLSPIGGRTDHIPLNVPSGSYVLPADVVSGLGQGNTLNGTKVLNSMFSSGPYGSPARPMRSGNRMPKPPRAFRPPKMKFADGGAPDSTGEPVPIVAAGGEYIVSPEQVEAIGGGDMDRGHAILDAFTLHVRNQHIKTLKKLPGPVKE